MKSEKRKFVIPHVEDLDRIGPSGSNSGEAVKIFKKSSDVEGRKRLLKALSQYAKKSPDEQSSSPGVGQDERLESRTDGTSSTLENPSSSFSVPEGSEPVGIRKTFKETFSFLKNDRYYEEAQAKMKEIESVPRNSVQPKVSIPSKPKSSAILVNPRQKENPVLKFIRCVPWEYNDIKPDYVLGATTCAIFLSLRYHHLNPDYIHKRLKQLGKCYELRILLILVDVKDPHQTLKELAKMAILADMTLILSWSSEEAGKYLEIYKVYENKPVDSLQGQSDGDYLSKLQDCLTTVRGINKTDVLTLKSTFGTLSAMTEASKDDLTFLPGFGEVKAARLQNILHEPFLMDKRKSWTEDGNTYGT